MEDCVVLLERDSRVEEAVISMSTSKISEKKSASCFVCGVSTTKKMGGPLRRHASYLRQVNSFMKAMKKGGETHFFGGGGGGDQRTSCATCCVVIKHVFDIQQKIASLQKELDEIVQSTRSRQGRMVLSSQRSSSSNDVICDAHLQVKVEEDDDDYDEFFMQSPIMMMETFPDDVVDGDGDVDVDNDRRNVESGQRRRSRRSKRSLSTKKKGEDFVYNALTDDDMEDDKDDDYNDGDDNDYDSCHDDSFEDFDKDDEDYDEDGSVKRRRRSHRQRQGQRPARQGENVCDKCGKGFSTEKYLNVHIRRVHSIKPYSCDQCERSFFRPYELQNHIKFRHAVQDSPNSPIAEETEESSEESSSCCICGKVLSTFKNRIIHEIKVCHVTTWTDEELDRLSIRFSKCTEPECDQMFSRKEDLVRHSLTHNPEEAADESWSCCICRKMLSSFKNRVIHEIKVCHVTTWSDKELNNLSIRFLKCTELGCNQMFSKKKDLYRHSLTHTGERNHLCSTCGQSFVRKSHLVVHKNTNCGTDADQMDKIREERRQKRKDNDNVDVSCKECSKQFASRRRLRVHMQRVHPSPRNLEKKVCHVCGLTMSQSQLSIHIRRVHMGEKRHFCSICTDRGFFDRKDLKYHVTRFHNEGQPGPGAPSVSCDICSKQFNFRRSLDSHKRRVHLKERKYPCTSCAARFFNPRELARHTKTHEEGGRKAGRGMRIQVAQHQCSKCGAKFIHRRNLERHLTNTKDDGKCKRAWKRPLKKRLKAKHEESGEDIVTEETLIEEMILGIE